MQIDPTGYNSKNDMDQNSFDKLMKAVKNTTLTMSDKPSAIPAMSDNACS